MKKDLRSKAFKGKDIYEGVDKDKVDDMKKLYNKYASKDEGELKAKLMEMTRQGRADGSLSNEQIDMMAKKIAPMLDGDKRQKLNSLIAMMKNNQS